MRPIITVSVNNGKEIGSFSICYKNFKEAHECLTNALPQLSRKGIFTAEQLCFQLLMDGIPIERNVG